jgi:hypothetical protein
MAESTLDDGITPWRKAVGEIWFAEECQMDVWAIGSELFCCRTVQPLGRITDCSVTLYIILTGYHPYDERYERDDTVVPETSGASRTGTTTLSSAGSWSNFRTTNPSFTVADGKQTQQEQDWRVVETRCIKFCVTLSSFRDFYLEI